MKHVIVADRFTDFVRNVEFFKQQCLALGLPISSARYNMTTYNNDYSGYRKRYSVTFKTN